VVRFSEPRGEFTIVIEGKKKQGEPVPVADIELIIKKMRRSGKKAKAAITELADLTGLSKKELYRLWLKQK
jgi:16S rRNA (cytidine1402-2'-O)-methyltransferase